MECIICEKEKTVSPVGICGACAAEGWKPHDGSEWPVGVKENDIVEIVLDGRVSSRVTQAGSWFWVGGIEAYRVIEHRTEESGDVNDPTNPNHYTSGSMELIDAFEGVLSNEEFVGACKFNITKYVMRFDKKNGVEDLKKAQWYLERLIGYMKKNND